MMSRGPEKRQRLVTFDPLLKDRVLEAYALPQLLQALKEPLPDGPAIDRRLIKDFNLDAQNERFDVARLESEGQERTDAAAEVPGADRGGGHRQQPRNRAEHQPEEGEVHAGGRFGGRTARGDRQGGREPALQAAGND